MSRSRVVKRAWQADPAGPAAASLREWVRDGLAHGFALAPRDAREVRAWAHDKGIRAEVRA